MKYFFMYDRKAITIRAFAPWFREQYIDCAYAVRTLCFYHALEKVSAGMEIKAESAEVCQWFDNWKGLYERTLIEVLGRFLGFNKMIISNVSWKTKEKRTNEAWDRHAWIHESQCNFQIDLTYGKFQDDVQCNRMFFRKGAFRVLGNDYVFGHPIELSKSYFFKRIVYEGGQYSGRIENEMLEFHPETLQAGSLPVRIYDLIIEKLDKNCPTMSDILSEYEDLERGTRPSILENNE